MNPHRLNVYAIITLVAGFAVATFVYLTTTTPVPDAMITEYENSKTYTRSLKLYGGQMAVLSDDFKRWFVGLWQGQNLALTIGVMSLIIAVCLTLEARYLRSHAEKPGQDDP